MANALKAALGLAVAGMLATAPAWADTQTETIVAEQRTSVSVRIKPEAAQGFLPAGWAPNAAAAGPTLSLIFMDRKLQLAPDGKPLQSGVNRLLVLAMSAKNVATGEVRSMIVGGYSTDPLGSPGGYKVYAPGVVALTRDETSEVRDGQPQTRVRERWTARGADGATVDFEVAFMRGVPTLTPFEQKNYSGKEPDFYRLYRGQQATDVLRNASGVNRVQSVSLKASGGVLGRAVDGSEQIVSISNAPFYTRQTFVP